MDKNKVIVELTGEQADFLADVFRQEIDCLTLARAEDGLADEPPEVHDAR